MPDWMKGGLILVAVGLAIWFSWNFLLLGSMEESFGRLEQVTEEVNAAGTAFGGSSGPEGCLAEMVHRVGGCEGDMMCGTLLSPFLWSCLEAAPRDRAFCATVPAPGDDSVQVAWERKTCARYGRPDDELCAMAVSLTSAFCSTQSTPH
jgi:hypothetical protein